MSQTLAKKTLGYSSEVRFKVIDWVRAYYSWVRVILGCC